MGSSVLQSLRLDAVDEGIEYAPTLGLTVKRDYVKKPIVLGSGSYGDVFLAHTESGEKRAYKVASNISSLPGYRRSPTAKHELECLKREMSFQMEIRHKNVVRFFHTKMLKKCVVFDMEFCDGNLLNLITVGIDPKHLCYKALSEPAFYDIAKQVNSGVRALHRMDIAHRDLKPENVLYVKDESTGALIMKISDLGSAKKQASFLRTVVGTFVYGAPELIFADGKNEYTVLCDMWSLGVMYYLMVVGNFPFDIASQKKQRLAKEEQKKSDAHPASGQKKPGDEEGKTIPSEQLMRQMDYLRQDFRSINIPHSVKVSDCCKHFIRSHLYKNPSERMSSEEAARHPFLLAKLHLLDLTSQIGDLLKPLVKVISLGDLCFEKFKKVNELQLLECHTFRSVSFSLTWGEVAVSLGISDLDDLIVFTSGGGCFTKDDVIADLYSESDIRAVMLYASKKFQREDLKLIQDVNFLPEIEKKWSATEKRSESDGKVLQERLRLMRRFTDQCSLLRRIHNNVVNNCQSLEKFRAELLTYEPLYNKVRALQQALYKKCRLFRAASFCPPPCDKYRQLVVFSEEGSELRNAIAEFETIYCKAQRKIDENQDEYDITDFNLDIADRWRKHKDIYARYEAQVDISFGTFLAFVKSLQHDCDLLIVLAKYKRVLEEALKADDPIAVFERLFPSVSCSFLKMEEDTSAPRKEDKREIVQKRRQQAQQVRDERDALRKELESLRQQLKITKQTAECAFDSNVAQIAHLKKQLNSHGIPDSFTL